MSKQMLELIDYGDEIHIEESSDVSSGANWRDHVHTVLQELGRSVPNNLSIDDSLRTLHGALAPIDPFLLSDALVEKIEIIASGVNRQQSPVDPLTLPSIATKYETEYPAANVTSIWVGDITQLQADVIVNAANTEMLGCRLPNHACIDNAIHSAAGPRLRDDCAVIMDRQGVSEQIGVAKITRGYALPARFVLHTVGPQLCRGAQPTKGEHKQLVNAYHSCLDLASRIESIRTIAFCAISTGIFSYPQELAAAVALNAVADWTNANAGRFDRVIFDLYSNRDALPYEKILADWGSYVTEPN